jgi:putative transcriptional regulator
VVFWLRAPTISYMSRLCLSVLLGLVLFTWGGAYTGAALMAPAPPAEAVRTPAPGMFLVAQRSFQSPFFRASVVYLVQHDAKTSLGVILNHPAQVRLAEWLPDLAGTVLGNLTLYDGGPIYPDMMVVLVESPSWQPGSTEVVLRQVAGDVYASFDPAIFGLLQQEDAGSFGRVRSFFGHVGWYAGQLEQEIQRGFWHLLPGDPDEVFGDDAGSLWLRLIERLEPAELVLPPTISLGSE